MSSTPLPSMASSSHQPQQTIRDPRLARNSISIRQDWSIITTQRKWKNSNPITAPLNHKAGMSNPLTLISIQNKVKPLPIQDTHSIQSIKNTQMLRQIQ